MPQISKRMFSKEEISELKLLEDKRRLIRQSMGREPQRPSRDVKAWLQKNIATKTDFNIYTGYNDMFEMEYQLQNQKAEIIINQFTRSRAQPSQAKSGPKSLSVDLVSSLYYSQLLDFDKPIQTVMNTKKQSALTQIIQMTRWKGQVKILQETRENPRTLWREKKSLTERIERLQSAISENANSIEETLQGTPFDTNSLVQEVETNKNNGFQSVQKIHVYDQLDQLTRENLMSMQAQSRQSLQLLGLTVLEARALKNRFSANSIAELVSAFLDRHMQNQQASFVKEVNDCLLNQAKTDKFIELLQEIVALRDLNEHKFVEVDQRSLQEQQIQTGQSDRDPSLADAEDTESAPRVQRYSKEKIYLVYLHLMTPFNEQTTESELIRHWLGVDIQIAREIHKVKNTNTLNGLLSSYANYEAVFSKQESYILENHSLVPKSKLDYINTLISKIKVDLYNLPFVFTSYMATQRQSLVIQDFGDEKLCREALEVMLQNLEEPAQSIVISNVRIDVNSFNAVKSYLESRSATVLDLSFTNTNDECLDMLATGASKNPVCGLKVLYLQSNNIAIQGALRIGSFLKATHALGKNLISLDLSRNKIANIGMESICHSLQKNRKLQYLDISYNQLEDRALYSIADMLKLNTCLNYLSCVGNVFTQRSLFHFAHCLTENQQSQLIVLRLGTVDCSRNEMNDFILRGIQHSNLNYLYIATTAVNAKCFEQVNSSIIGLTICPVNSQNASTSTKIKQSFEKQATDYNFNAISNGIQILKEMCREKGQNAEKTEVLVFVFQMRCTPSENFIDQTTYFHFAVGQGDVKDVLTCLKQGIDCTYRSKIKERLGWTALHIAANNGHLEVVQLLLNTEKLLVTDTSESKMLPLHCAAASGHLSVCRLLVDYYNSPVTVTDITGQTPLHLCIQNNSEPLFKFLEGQIDKARKHQNLVNKAVRALDIPGMLGRTPIMQAVLVQALEIFRYLITNECDISLVDMQNENVLHLAVKQKQFNLLFQMLRCDIFDPQDLYIENQAGQSPLSLVVEQGYIEVLQEMKKYGADLSIQDSAGNTLLHIACKSGSKQIVRYLIETRLFTQDTKNDAGETCVDVCQDSDVKQATVLYLQNVSQEQMFGKQAFSKQPSLYRN